MKINFETQIVVDRNEYERLCRLDGAVDAVQNFVDNHGEIKVDDIFDILGINKSKRNINLKREKEEDDALYARLQKEAKKCTSEF